MDQNNLLIGYNSAFIVAAVVGIVMAVLALVTKKAKG